MTLTTLELTDVKTAVLTEINNSFLYVAVGTGTAAVSPSDTTLSNETLRQARLSATVGSNNVSISSFVSSAQANGSTLAEAGAFDSAVSGQMQNRTKFATPVVKTSDKEIYIDYIITPTVTQ